MSVCFCVCLFVHFLRYHLNVFLPPFPKVGCPKWLEIRNHWGKVVERRGLRFEHFCSKMVLNRCGENIFLKDFLKNSLAFKVPFKSLFVPTSQSRMSKIFRDFKRVNIPVVRGEEVKQQTFQKIDHVWTVRVAPGYHQAALNPRTTPHVSPTTPRKPLNSTITWVNTKTLAGRLTEARTPTPSSIRPHRH